MDWITQNQAQEAAEQGELPALECSWKHHKQGRNSDWIELKEAIENDKFCLSWELCACCRFVGKQDGFKDNGCRKCPLGDFFCWDNIIWAKVRNSWAKLTNHFSNANFKAFQEAEAELCTYIERVIEKVKKEAEIKDKYDKEKCKKCEPKLRHGDYGYYAESGNYWCVWKQEETLEIFGKNSGSGRVAEEENKNSDMVKDGNHVDDLERNSEDLEGFGVGAGSQRDIFTAKWDGGHKDTMPFAIGVNGKSFWFDGKQVIEIHQKLGQLIATAERSQKC